MIATNSCSRTVKLTPRSASTETSPERNTFVTSSSSMTAWRASLLIDRRLRSDACGGGGTWGDLVVPPRRSVLRERGSLFLHGRHLRKDDPRPGLESLHDLDSLVVLEPRLHLDLDLLSGVVEDDHELL